jgi:hypothetical protein
VDWLPVLLVVIAAGAVLGGLPLLAARVRRGGTGGAVLGPFEDMWHPAAQRARLEVETRQEAPAPEPVPGDKLF